MTDIPGLPLFNHVAPDLVEATFGLKLTTDGGELFFGGADATLYTGDIELHTLAQGTPLWQLIGGSIIVTAGTETEVAADDITTTLDSGTPVIYGSADQVESFYGLIDGEVYKIDSDTITWSYPCGNTKQVGFRWGAGSLTWKMSSDRYAFDIVWCRYRLIDDLQFQHGGYRRRSGHVYRRDLHRRRPGRGDVDPWRPVCI